MLLVNAGAAEFDQFIANRLEWFEKKFLRAVIAAIFCGARAGFAALRLRVARACVDD